MDQTKDITWLGHAGFFFEDKTSGNNIYYIDPFALQERDYQNADLIFITHAHPDHLSLDDIQKLLSEESVVIATPDSLARIDLPDERKQAVTPNENYNVKDFSFQTIPAYNTHPERLQAHPKGNNWVGYIFEINGQKIYHAGDTDFIPEMKELASLHLDVAMLPIGGTYTMDTLEAADAANTIAAKITIPMHYKRLLGGKANEAENTLKKLVTHSEVRILQELQ